MVCRRKHGTAWLSTYEDFHPVADDSPTAPSLAAQAIRASSAHRDSSISSAYGESAIASANRESDRLRSSQTRRINFGRVADNGSGFYSKSPTAIHRRVHGLIGGFLKSPAAKAQVADGIQRCVVQSLRRWHTGQLIYIQDEAKEIAFQVLVKVLMSINPGVLKKEFTEFIQGIICLPVKLPGTRLSKSLKAKDKIWRLIRKIIEDKMSIPERRSVNDVMDENDTNEEQQISLDSICGSTTEMMIPGDHSVPMMMTLAVKYLTDSPLALKKLTAENMNLKRKKNSWGEPYVWTDYMSLTFTQYVINETFRMGNIINDVWKKAGKDVEIKGYLIPKDWSVLASFSSIHLDEKNYLNPSEFNPWRVALRIYAIILWILFLALICFWLNPRMKLLVNSL